MKFDYTVEGCREATKYLQELGKYHLVSMEDGFVITAYANDVYKKRAAEAEKKREEVLCVK